MLIIIYLMLAQPIIFQALKAAFLTCDFKGENHCTTWGYASNNKIKVLDSQNLPNSLGLYMQRLQHYLATHR